MQPGLTERLLKGHQCLGCGSELNPKRTQGRVQDMKVARRGHSGFTGNCQVVSLNAFRTPVPVRHAIEDKCTDEFINIHFSKSQRRAHLAVLWPSTLAHDLMNMHVP